MILLDSPAKEGMFSMLMHIIRQCTTKTLTVYSSFNTIRYITVQYRYVTKEQPLKNTFFGIKIDIKLIS